MGQNQQHSALTKLYICMHTYTCMYVCVCVYNIYNVLSECASCLTTESPSFFKRAVSGTCCFHRMSILLSLPNGKRRTTGSFPKAQLQASGSLQKNRTQKEVNFRMLKHLTGWHISVKGMCNSHRMSR